MNSSEILFLAENNLKFFVMASNFLLILQFIFNLHNHSKKRIVKDILGQEQDFRRILAKDNDLSFLYIYIFFVKLKVKSAKNMKRFSSKNLAFSF